MKFTRLGEWLNWQEQLNSKGIDLGLDRVQIMLGKLNIRLSKSRTITVAGTNGKGSTCAYLESIYREHGYTTGLYSSPHLLHYNERVRLSGLPVADERLMAAFEKIEQARGDIPLSFFEFGTLAALLIFEQSAPDVVILEVGLGGRLDAVNAVDPDCAVITHLALDHQDWLGDTLEEIAAEKAGIIRPGIAVICQDNVLPKSVIQKAADVGAVLYQRDQDFTYREDAASLQFTGPGEIAWRLPKPRMPGVQQYANLCTALMAALSQADAFPLDEDKIASAVSNTLLPGRLQKIMDTPEVWVDVAHNADAATLLSDFFLKRNQKLQLVMAMAADKNVAAFTKAISPVVHDWYVGQFDHHRSMQAEELASIVTRHSDAPVHSGNTLAELFKMAVKEALASDSQVLVTGSFHTVESILKEMNQ